MSNIQMMTDRFFLYPTDRASKDYSYYVKKYVVYRYELIYSGRKSFLDILHKESPQEVANSFLGELYISTDFCVLSLRTHVWYNFVDLMPDGNHVKERQRNREERP